MLEQSNEATDDRIATRLGWAVALSVALNFVIWRSVSAIARLPELNDLKPVEITRVVAPPPIPKSKPKPPPVKRFVEPPKPKPVLKPARAAIPNTRPPQPVKIAKLPLPPTAHNHVISAAAKPNDQPKPDDHVALPGGNAAPGKPIATQLPGNGKVNPPAAPTVTPAPIPAPAPAVVKPTPVPPPVIEPPQTPPRPQPAPPPAPKRKGPTREAQPTDEVKPEIPDDLKKSDFKSFVRVKVEVREDGGFDVILRTSSGDEEIDRRVLDALKRWRWKPALKDGEPVASTQLFKFEFEVE